MTERPDTSEPAGPYDVLDEAIEDAQVQLKRMWSLRARMERMAQAATIGAGFGLAATSGMASYVAWLIGRTGDARQILAHPDPFLLLVAGLLFAVLVLSVYLWGRRAEARSGGLMLEDEIVTVRRALDHALQVDKAAIDSALRSGEHSA